MVTTAGKSLLELVSSLEASDARVRHAAVKALRARPHRAAAAYLTERLADTSPRVRRAAVFAVAELGTEALPFLTRGLVDPRTKVVAAARTALRRIVGKLGSDVAPNGPLSRCFANPDPAVRAAVARVLPELLGDQAVPLLLWHLQIEQDPQVRCTVAHALATLGQAVELDATARMVPSRATQKEQALPSPAPSRADQKEQAA